jgi:hypothetical protein
VLFVQEPPLLATAEGALDGDDFVVRVAVLLGAAFHILVVGTDQLDRHLG